MSSFVRDVSVSWGIRPSSMKQWNILNSETVLNFRLDGLKRWDIFPSADSLPNETAVSFWENEKFSEKLSAIRKRLQSILACIFALRIFDRGKKMACTSKSRRNKEEQPRNLKNIVRVNVWESLFWKDVAGPQFILGEHCSREIIQIACPFSFLSFSGDLYAFLDELLRSLTYLQQWRCS